MFYTTLVYLGLLAAVLVLWIDVPRVIEVNEVVAESPAARMLPASDVELAFEEASFAWGKVCGLGLLLLWPVFIAEQAFYFVTSCSRRAFAVEHPRWWLFCVLPPLRLCAHWRGQNEQVWLPRLGWQTVDRGLRKRLERNFSLPMIWIALLILPVLGLQFYYQDRITEFPRLCLALHVGTGLIWYAFAVEFIVMVSVAENKLAYCKKHWLDLAIVLLPLISFLRGLRVLRASKLLKVGKLQQLTRVVRVYRLRGVAMRGLRAMMLFEVLHRLLRTSPEKRLRRLEQARREKQYELAELEEEINLTKNRMAEVAKKRSATG